MPTLPLALNTSLISAALCAILMNAGCASPRHAPQSRPYKSLGKEAREQHRASEKGKISTSTPLATHTPHIHPNGCVQSARKTALIRTAEDALSAYRLEDGLGTWTFTQRSAELVACPTQGALIYTPESGELVILDYESGEVLETHAWTPTGMEGYQCSELRTLPMPGDAPGFAWSVSPSYTHGGTPPSDEEEERARRAQCCVRGTALIQDKHLTSTPHEHHTGSAYGSTGHTCALTQATEEASEQSAWPDGPAVGKDLGTLVTIEETGLPARPSTQVIDLLPDGRVFFLQSAHGECDTLPARAGIATKREDGTWSTQWSADTFMRGFCPIP